MVAAQQTAAAARTAERQPLGAVGAAEGAAEGAAAGAAPGVAAGGAVVHRSSGSSSSSSSSTAPQTRTCRGRQQANLLAAGGCSISRFWLRMTPGRYGGLVTRTHGKGA
jgi:hypothetical protein